ncbi:MAG: MBL fold metallo-hydrolase [Candidatus Dormibacteria bacterium]
MRLTVIGSGAAFTPIAHNACMAVDNAVLVDCGAPAHVLLPRAGLNPNAIDTVLLTHFHADHSIGMVVLLAARALVSEPVRPLRIAGPVGTREYLERLVRAGYGGEIWDAVVERLGLETVVLQDGATAPLGEYTVAAHAVVHGLGPSLAYVLQGPDGVRLGISGDTTDCAGLHRVIAASDAVVVECTGWDGPVQGNHLSRADVVTLVARYPDVRFVLSHLSERGPLPGAIIAHDGIGLDLLPAGPPLPQPPSSLGS